MLSPRQFFILVLLGTQIFFVACTGKLRHSDQSQVPSMAIATLDSN